MMSLLLYVIFMYLTAARLQVDCVLLCQNLHLLLYSLTPSLTLFLFQEWTPDKKHKKGKKEVEQKAVVMERRSVYYSDICCRASQR